MKKYSYVVLGILIFSCGHVPQIHYYTIDYPLVSKGNTPSRAILCVQNFKADPSYAQDKMVYRAAPYELKFDHYRRWIAAPSHMVTEKICTQIRSLQLFEHVTTQLPHDQNCLVLTGTIKQFEEVVGSAAHIARVALWVEVHDFPEREVCWAGLLNAEEPINRNDITSIIEAMSLATKNCISQLAEKLADLPE
jgi:ABC-type uncharacterized transport system auxiliary subunit